MNPEFASRLLAGIQKLTELVETLTGFNRELLAGTVSAETMQPVLDQREISFQDFMDFRKEVELMLTEAEPTESRPDIARLLEIVEAGSPQGKESVGRFRQALKELVSSDAEVVVRMEKEKQELAALIRNLRQGSAAMKGYFQADPTGSCFIDKIK